MQHILFLDVETVPELWNFDALPERKQHLFKKKYFREIEERSRKTNITPDSSPSDVMVMLGLDEASNQIWREQAAFNAEFNKIVCVSIGKVETRPTPPEAKPMEGLAIKVKSLTSQFEIDILKDLEKILATHSSICGHFIKEFDVPVLSRKYLMHKLPLPRLLDVRGLKPWETPHLDTMEMWKFGSYRHTASLDLLAECFGVPSPKTDMDGSMVGKVYYEGTGELGVDKDQPLKKIATYCENDVITDINVYRGMNGMEIIPLENVIRI